MTLRERQSQTWVSRFIPRTGATESPQDRVAISVPYYLIFDSAEDAGSLPIALSGPGGTEGVVAGLFPVGFRPQGRGTAVFGSAVDFAFESRVRAVEADRQRIQREKNRRAVALLESWLNVDDETGAEHRETLEYLAKALNEDRTSNRKLFP